MSKPIPDDLPLHPAAVGQLHMLKPSDETPLFRAIGQEMSASLEQLLTLADSGYDISAALKDLAQCATEVDTSASEIQQLGAQLDVARDTYTRESKDCTPASVDTWNSYCSGELSTPSLATIMASASASEGQPSGGRNSSALGPEGKLLRILPLLWADPRAVIPDEDADSDDVVIDGGHIELTCPITCKMYGKPMISSSCQHVFDYDGIREYIGDNGSRSCPQAGCSKTLTMRDFAPDPVMALRCRLATIQEHQASAGTASQQLDVL